jgi:hypothetical protein
MKKNYSYFLLLSAFVIDTRKMTITNGIIILKHQCPFEPIKAKNKEANFEY